MHVCLSFGVLFGSHTKVLILTFSDFGFCENSCTAKVVTSMFAFVECGKLDVCFKILPLRRHFIMP